MVSYGFVKTLSMPFDEVKRSVTAALKDEGFGVLTEIALHEKFAEKLGVKYPRYLILGACNPPAAYKAVQAEEEIGLLLPCNVVLREKDGNTVLSVIRPTVAMSMIENPALAPLAREIEEKLERVVERVGGTGGT
jgi:uncharacterized protein (DUF302 family)